MIDSGAVRKTMRSHGDRGVEAARRPPQSAVTPRDFGRIPRIVAEGKVVSGRPAKSGGRATAKVTYEATIGRYRYLYTEEVRNVAGDVALKTMWKFPA